MVNPFSAMIFEGETPNSEHVSKKPSSQILMGNFSSSSNKNNNFVISRIYLTVLKNIRAKAHEGSDIIKKLAKTVVIVTFLSCFERGLGFLYRVFLSRTVGSEGLGLYQIALSVIGVLITLSASGIPITVSRLMIKERAISDKAGEDRAVSAGVISALAVSLVCCLFFFLFKKPLDYLFADPRCSTLFLIILPGVVLTSVYAVIRGFFWGNKSFYTYSIIELLEEVVMIAFGVFLVLKGKTIFQKTIYASVAVLISYVFSFALSSTVFAIRGGKIVNPKEQLKPLITSSTPITLMRTANSFTSSLIAIIFPAVLIACGQERESAVSQFGVISGMALPLLFIPSTLIGSFSLVLAPELSENYYTKNTRKIKAGVEKSLLYSVLISALIIPAFTACGKYVGQLVYNNSLAGTYVKNCSFLMIPMSITIISTSLLNSMGFEKKTLKYFLLGSALLILSIVIFPKFLGNYALVLGYFLSYLLNAILNVLLLKKVCCNKLDFNKKLLIILPLCVAFCLFNQLLFNLLSAFIGQFFAMIISCFIVLIFHAVCLFIFKIVNFEDLKR